LLSIYFNHSCLYGEPYVSSNIHKVPNVVDKLAVELNDPSQHI